MPKALVVDDEAALTGVIARQLQGAGFEVDTANSGFEALAMVRDGAYDAVIVDVMMPNMDGYEVCRRLRSDPRTARVAIVVLTARGQLIDKQVALAAGADAHLAKPHKGHDLAELVGALLAKKRTGGTRRCQQVVVLRLAPAVGATTVALNLASGLQTIGGHSVAVVAAARDGGQLNQRLALPALSSWPAGDARDPNVVAGRMARHKTGLWVLPAPPPNAAPVSPDDLGGMLRVLNGWHDYVIVDTPFNCGPLAPILVHAAHLILLVVEADANTLRSAPAGIQAIQKLAGRSLQVWPVVNKAMAAGDLLRQQVEQTLRQPVMAMIPNDPAACTKALKAGLPVVLDSPDSPLAASMRDLAERVHNLTAGRPRRLVSVAQD